MTRLLPPALLLALVLAAPAAARGPLQPIVEAGAPGAVLQVDGRGHAAGVADLRTRRPLSPRDAFRIGSITKTFTATVVLQLVGERRLALSDTVEQRLPGVLPDGDAITVRQLLNHTSGIPDDLATLLGGLYHGDRFRRWTPREVIALVADKPRRSGWHYSSINYVLAGLIVERATGRSLGSEIERRILRPLHLRHTAFPVHETAIRGRSAGGYSLARNADLQPIEGPLLDFTRFDPSVAWAGGNMTSTAGDLTRFFGALLGGRVLAPRQLAEMKRTVPTGREGSRYGLGLFAFELPCGTRYGNDGDIPGFSTTVIGGRRTVALMVNAQAAPDAVDAPFDRALEAAACR